MCHENINIALKEKKTEYHTEPFTLFSKKRLSGSLAEKSLLSDFKFSSESNFRHCNIVTLVTLNVNYKPDSYRIKTYLGTWVKQRAGGQLLLCGLIYFNVRLNSRTTERLTVHHITPPILTITNITGKGHHVLLFHIQIKKQNTIYNARYKVNIR